MTRTFNIYAAKTHLSNLIDQAAAGTEIIIARAGRPVAKLVSLGGRKHRLGALKGKLKVPSDFDAPLPKEILSAFEE